MLLLVASALAAHPAVDAVAALGGVLPEDVYSYDGKPCEGGYLLVLNVQGNPDTKGCWWPDDGAVGSCGVHRGHCRAPAAKELAFQWDPSPLREAGWAFAYDPRTKMTTVGPWLVAAGASAKLDTKVQYRGGFQLRGLGPVVAMLREAGDGGMGNNAGGWSTFWLDVFVARGDEWELVSTLYAGSSSWGRGPEGQGSSDLTLHCPRVEGGGLVLRAVHGPGWGDPRNFRDPLALCGRGGGEKVAWISRAALGLGP